ncbi:stimulus-sensing domain-containing protein [Telmatospirillum sp.]|uniref:stimulus-sensing domain-containing protein n=1 Tax=Telmatospirillum sp. TaxID=2079197 RepID=UPI002841FED8|nr:stimulus-sensing domain-containing protein [Telmatospirillum sp.]MDR3440388.1 stimulus-sensing domain-containing protein [Telmatospirillum sp.]
MNKELPSPRPLPGPLGASHEETRSTSRRGRWRWLPLTSPLTWRILAVNMVAPVLLVGGLFYLDRYKNELIAAELESLRIRAEMVAAALGEGTVIDSGFALPELSPQLARQMVRRLSPPARVRARLFTPQGDELADSRLLLSANTPIQVEDLPDPDRGWFVTAFRRIYDFITDAHLVDNHLPLYRERSRPRASDYSEVTQALAGDSAWAIRSRNHRLLLSTAVPVQRYKQVLGAVMVSSSGDDIAQSLFKVRLTIFQAFAFALIITITLSLYLAGTIARPIRRLAAAAERVRRGHGRRPSIPDLSQRHDEIGELSAALRDMTEALWKRMDAIESFAADVSHELKNPLTSLRSAVETVSRVTDPEQQRKLMAIIQDDVGRLDRLISDISDASRLDAELSRAESEPVEMLTMAETLAEVYRDTGAADQVAIVIEATAGDSLAVNGIESRLVQILRNLISNALSFSPPQATLRLKAYRDGRWVCLSVADDGPGIPENKLEAIFDRFYSERPKAEKFGTHSGLGLSISKQIAEAHGGTLTASNRTAPDGTIKGACFTLRLPAANSGSPATPQR